MPRLIALFPYFTMLTFLFLICLLCTYELCHQQDLSMRSYRKRSSPGLDWRIRQQQKANRHKNIAKTERFLLTILEYNNKAKLRNELEDVVNVSINAHIFYESFNEFPIPMSSNEGKFHVPCSFAMADCQMEIIEHRLVDMFVKPTDGVVEVSCLLVDH